MNQTALNGFLSESAQKATRSEIRELLALISRPGMISLAGGLPAPETFPVEMLAEIAPRLLREEGTSVLQYGRTEGEPAFVAELLTLLERSGIKGRTPANVLVTSSSQQALDLVARVFLGPGDAVLMGLPSYLGAIGAFNACGARLVGVPLDEQGLRPDLLEEQLVELRRIGARAKLIYLVPDFDNPTGVTLSLARRREVLAIARDFDLLVVEDGPYRDLRFEGASVPSLQELDGSGRVLSLFSFSKVLCPGLRLGYVVGDEPAVASLTVAKQNVDLCTGGFVQALAREVIRSGALPGLMSARRSRYDQGRRTMLRALEELIDPAFGVTWTRPEGGMFVWVTLPEGMDARDLLERALIEDVAFVTGRAFHCDGSGRNTLRLCFSYPSLADIREGIARLARAIAALREDLPDPQPRLAVLEEAIDSGHLLDQLAWKLAFTEVAS
jgi:2-aminoadipate transaminase